MTTRTAVLAHAARLARHAPSILNTQPWSWRIGRHTAELRTDPTRRLPHVDPQQHLILLSCGAALHHATIAVHALGWDVEVEHGTDPVARLVIANPATQRDTDLAAAITRRHTDRRPFSAQTPSDETITHLRRAAETQGLHTHLVRRDEIPLLAATTARAASDAAHRPGHTAEVAHWATGAGSAGGRRPVPMRALHGPATGDGDIGARYLVLHGPGDTPTDWLRAGEALSALLLTATVHGIACSPMSEAVEAPWPRGLLATLIGEPCHPYLVIRCGYPTHDEPPPATPRRPEAETTTYLMGASTRP
ncbi:nitroreductase family protein [Actinoplanes sichuanensis]|uniref:Acg family FMN-binding oxidoreductase n=1 Tax=Actinoplanes sichuanensis TaxID=512349 RepID=A0ABW4ASC0_9ACTN|nr:nitroreductase [Actinoplanes sichuanensis]BEL07296.1 nitroreductase family protein [Actinoplanes sichuanensis]